MSHIRSTALKPASRDLGNFRLSVPYEFHSAWSQFYCTFAAPISSSGPWKDCFAQEVREQRDFSLVQSFGDSKLVSPAAIARPWPEVEDEGIEKGADTGDPNADSIETVDEERACNGHRQEESEILELADDMKFAIV